MKVFLTTHLSLALLAGLLHPVLAQQEPILDQLIDPISLSSDGSTLTIVFDDRRATDETTHFEVEHSDDVSRWVSVVNQTAAVEDTLVPKRYTITAPEPGTVRKFYRILAFSTSATDSDGDGLSDAFEAQIGTNPATVDSDGDGFRDGFEFLAGTDPNDPNEFPDDQRHLPEVEFETVLSSATEGDGPHTLAITASDNFTGTVHYAVNARSSAISGVDFQALPNTVNLTSGTGAITLDLIDDTNISKQERLLLIDILPDPGSAYRASGGVTHVVCISDNDAYWSGVLVTEDLERTFRLCIAQGSTGTEMSFTSGTSDGLADIDEGQSSQSTGVIPSKDANGNPKEIWEANGQFNPSFNVTTGSFLVEREGIPINVGGSSAQLLRRLRLVAFDSLEGQTVQKNVIVGEFLEEVRHKDDPSITYLDITRNGTFSLFRDISESASIESPLDPTN